MNYLKIASAALAAFVMVGCSDKKGDCCGKSETCCEKKDAACCESVVAQTVSPRFTAQADAVALIEPQALVKTALKILDEVKGGLPEEQVKEAEEYIAKVKKLGVEDLDWVAISGDTTSGAGAVSYARPLADLMKVLEEVSDSTAEKIDVSGADAAYLIDKGGYFAQVGKVVLIAAKQADLEAQVKLYTEGYAAPAAFADIKTSDNGILNVKISSFGKALKITGNGSSVVNQVLPDGERLLKECGELTIKVTTESAEISLEAGSVTDATTIKTALDSVVMMAKMAYEEHKAELVAELPPAVKEQLPAVDAAVKSLACTQKGKVVTLSVKAEILKLAEALAPVVLSSASNR